MTPVPRALGENAGSRADQVDQGLRRLCEQASGLGGDCPGS